jgi:hypothetical protein
MASIPRQGQLGAFVWLAWGKGDDDQAADLCEKVTAKLHGKTKDWRCDGIAARGQFVGAWMRVTAKGQPKKLTETDAADLENLINLTWAAMVDPAAVAEYESRTLMEADQAFQVDVYPPKGILTVLGRLEGITYDGTLQGERAHYTHSFRPNAQPMLVVDEANTLHIIGGNFSIEDVGIVDGSLGELTPETAPPARVEADLYDPERGKVETEDAFSDWDKIGKEWQARLGTAPLTRAPAVNALVNLALRDKPFQIGNRKDNIGKATATALAYYPHYVELREDGKSGEITEPGKLAAGLLVAHPDMTGFKPKAGSPLNKKIRALGGDVALAGRELAGGFTPAENPLTPPWRTRARTNPFSRVTGPEVGAGALVTMMNQITGKSHLNRPQIEAGNTIPLMNQITGKSHLADPAYRAGTYEGPCTPRTTPRQPTMTNPWTYDTQGEQQVLAWSAVVPPEKEEIVAALVEDVETVTKENKPPKKAHTIKPVHHDDEQELAERITPFTTDDETRGMLHWAWKADNVPGKPAAESHLVATDGHRLAMIPVREKTAAAIEREGGALGLWGESPPPEHWRQVLPDQSKLSHGQVDAHALQALVKAAKKLQQTPAHHAQTGDVKKVFIAFTKTGAEVHEGAEAVPGLRAKLRGGKGWPEIGPHLEPKYVGEAIKGAFGSVEIGLSEPDAHLMPVMLSREDGELHVIMPIRV